MRSIFAVVIAASLLVGTAFGATQSLPSVTFTSPSTSDPTTGLLLAGQDTYPNWVNAGLIGVGGIPNRTTICATVKPTGIIPPANNDDATLINNAITACPVGDVLMLSAGIFQIDQSEYIAENKGITLRGTGKPSNSCSVEGGAPCWPTVINVYNGAIADSTISATTAGTNCGVNTSKVSGCSAAAGVILLSPSGNYNWGWAGCFLGTTPTKCGTLLAVDAAQGQNTIQVASTNNFSVGMWVLIDENPEVVSTTNPTGGAKIQASPEFLSNSPSPATMRLAGGDEPADYSFNPNRVNAELHLIKSIGVGPCPGTGCTLTFDDPLTLAFRQSGNHDAQVYWPTIQGSTANPFLQYAGVENLTITKSANSGVQLMFCAYCWVKNIEVGGWIAGAVNVDASARSQIDSNYFHDCYDCENNGTEYPLGINQASTETYAVNNIIVRGGKGMVGRASNTAVIAYNYVDDTFYMASSIGDYWMDMDLNGSHYAGTHHFLFEGNWGDNCDSDETHGNAIYHTFFRNECTGVRTTFVDPSNGKTVNDTTGQAWGNQSVASAPGPQRAAGPMAFDYWFAYVGNVLGLSGVTTPANGWSYQGAFCGGCTSTLPDNKVIWMSGWVGSEWPSYDPNLTATTGAFIFRHANFDYVTGNVTYASGYTHNLTNSFYLNSAPPFFNAGTSCTYPWPWVKPETTPPIQINSCGGSGLPALARWNAGTPFTQP